MSRRDGTGEAGTCSGEVQMSRIIPFFEKKYTVRFFVCVCKCMKSYLTVTYKGATAWAHWILFDSFSSHFHSLLNMQAHSTCVRKQNDSVLGKRVLTYWESRGTPDYSQMNGFMVGIENYIFVERGMPQLFKKYSFPWVLLAHPSGCNQELSYFPQISQYVSTLFPNTESNRKIFHICWFPNSIY